MDNSLFFTMLYMYNKRSIYPVFRLGQITHTTGLPVLLL